MLPNTPVFIHFNFEGVNYRCPIDADETNLIKLPDGRILTANNWTKTYPPKPLGLHEIQTVPAKVDS